METLPDSVPPAAKTGVRRWMLAALMVLVLSAGQWWDTRSRLNDLQQDLVRRLADSDKTTQEVRGGTRADHELLQEVQGRVGILEAKLAESQTQAVALDAMYQDLLRSRDERLLADVEQTLAIAAQQLQLAGNVEAALIALQSIDTRLAGAAQPRFVPLRRLVTRDIERFKTLPAADITGIAVKIEQITASVDSLPLAFEQRPPIPNETGKKKAPSAKGLEPVNPPPYWRVFADELWRELRQLIRIQRIDQGEPALLAPAQTYFLRENLKLRLLSARLALLQRDGKTYHEELNQAQQVLEKYFDASAKPVQVALASASKLAEIDLALDLPGLGATLAAVRSLRQARPGTH